MKQIGFLDSNIIRALLVALAGLVGMVVTKLGLQFDDKFWADMIDAGLLVLTTGAALYAAWSRTNQPTPPISDTAVARTEERTKKEGGFARPGMLGFLCVLALATAAGCAGTREAYKAAANSADPAAETAYVMAEQYSASLDQASVLATNPATPRSAVQAIKTAELAATPLVLSLHGLRDSYLAVKSAENAAALQTAVNDAVLKVGALLRAIKTARGAP